MRRATALVLALVLAGCSSTASSPTFTLADGKVYTQTDCPAAANLLIGGHRAADALPMKGQTDRSRVERELAGVRDRLMRSNDVVAVASVPRNGEVWYPLADGGYAVELVEDYHFEVLLGPDGVCPAAPYSINGIPVVYNRAQ